MKPIRRFIHDLLTMLAYLVHPESLLGNSERFKECDYWFDLCNKEFTLYLQAHERRDYEAAEKHRQQHRLLSRRFTMAKDGHFTKG